MARRCFYSFHYKPDSARASLVRNIGVLDGNRPVSDNDWETVTRAGEDAIKRWIADQMYGKSCVVVLVGAETATRKWVKYEIKKAWEDRMGVVGIRIHGLKDLNGMTAAFGPNPFDEFNYDGKKLSSIVRCYDPQGVDSKDKYAWISKHLANAVEEAVQIRANC